MSIAEGDQLLLRHVHVQLAKGRPCSPPKGGRPGAELLVVEPALLECAGGTLARLHHPLLMGEEYVDEPMDRMDGDPVRGVFPRLQFLALARRRVDLVKVRMVRTHRQRDLAFPLPRTLTR